MSLVKKKNVASVYIDSVYNCCLIQDSGTITEEKKKKQEIKLQVSKILEPVTFTVFPIFYNN